MMTRTEHVAWSKKRALAELDAGADHSTVLASMVSDLGKHPETERHVGNEIGLMMLMAGQLDSPAEMRKFVKGYN